MIERWYGENSDGTLHGHARFCFWWTVNWWAIIIVGGVLTGSVRVAVILAINAAVGILAETVFATNRTMRQMKEEE